MTSVASVKESCNQGPAADGLALELGEVDADGLSDGDSLGLGLTLALGDAEALSLLDGDTLAEGDTDGLTLGEPTEATLRSSTMPPTLGEAVLSVKLPLATVATALNT